MKKILSIAAVMCGGLLAAQSMLITNVTGGQSTTLAPNSVISVSTVSFNTKLDFDIKNVSTVTHTFNAKRYDVLLNSTATETASAYFCFGGLCYGAETYVSPNPIVLRPGKAASDTSALYYILQADLDEANKKGCSEIRYTFYDLMNTSDSVQINVRYNCVTTGIRVSQRASTVELFPNPAHDNVVLRINAVASTETSANLYNALGDKVAQKALSLREGTNSVQLDLSALPTGLYFISINADSGTITRRIVKE